MEVFGAGSGATGSDHKDIVHLHREILNLDQGLGQHDRYPGTHIS